MYTGKGIDKDVKTEYIDIYTLVWMSWRKSIRK